MTPAPPIRNDRLLIGFCIAAAGTLLITIVAVAGTSSLLLVDRVLRDGPFLAAWCLAAGGFGHWPTIGLAPKDAPRMLLKITGIGIGFGVMSLLTLGLGTLGWLNTTTAYGLLAVGAILFPWHELLKHRRPPKNVPPFPEPGERASAPEFIDAPNASIARPFPRAQGETGSRLSPLAFAWLPIIALGGIMLIADCVPPGLLWTDEPHGYDVVEYHLQVPREWYEAGRITPLDHNVFSYLPMNVEMHYLLAMHLRGGPWAGMYLAQMMNSVFIIVMIATLWTAVGWPAALIAAAVPWLTMLGSICYVEAGQLMWATLAIVWLLRAETYRTVCLAGFCAGFACGAKMTALPMLVFALPISIWAANRGNRLWIVRGGIFSVVACALFSPWLIDNAIRSGNPIFPEAQQQLGRHAFTATQQQRWEASQTPPLPLRAFGAQILEFVRQTALDWRWGFALLPLCFAAFAMKPDVRQRSLALAIVAQALFWMRYTHLQGRFALLILPLAAIMIGRIDRRWWSGGVMTVSILVCIGGSFSLLNRLRPFVTVLGVDDFKGILPSNAADAMDANQPIALIGDARAFWYQTPMTKLHYRTVFDVRATSDQSAADHWLDPADIAGSVRIVDEGELRRLCRTYYGLPKAD